MPLLDSETIFKFIMSLFNFVTLFICVSLFDLDLKIIMFDFHATFFGPDDKIKNYINEYIKVQDMLLFMAQKDIPNVFNRLFQTFFLADEQRIDELVHIFFSNAEAKPQKIPIYAELLSKLLNDSEHQINVDYLKNSIFNEVFIDNKSINKRNNYFRVFRMLLSKKLYSIEQVIERIKQIRNANAYFTAILYFLDFISDEIVNELIQKQFESVRPIKMLPSYIFLQNRNELIQNNFEKYKQYIEFGCTCDSATYAILKDDATLYSQRAKKMKDKEDFIKDDDPFRLWDAPSDMKLAFLTAATNVSKYMYKQKYKLQYEATYLGASSSSEMVEMWTTKPSQDTIIGCAYSHDWVFLDWLYEYCGSQLDPDHANELILESSIRNFPRGVLLAQRIKNYDLNEGDITEMNPLFYAIANRNYAIAILLASDPRIDIELLRKDNNTILHYAAKTKCVELVRILLERGANPNLQNDKGNTPLHKAAKTGCVNVIKLLIQLDGNVNIENKKGLKPIDLAKTDDAKDVISKTRKQIFPPKTMIIGHL